MANRRPLVVVLLGLLVSSLVVGGFAYRAGIVSVSLEEVPGLEGEEVPGLEGTVLGGGQPDVAVRPRSVSFAGVDAGETTTREVRIHNRGNGTLAVRNVSVAGGAAFDLAAPPPETVPAGESAAVAVEFAPATDDAAAGTLVVETNDPDDRRVATYLSTTGTNVTLGLETVDNRTRVSARVVDATAGQPVTVSVPTAEQADAVGQLASLTVTPERDGAFALNATADAAPLDSTPPVNDSDAVEELGYVSVDHTIDNAAIANASLTYRIEKATMERMQSEPPDVALYRHEDGRWDAKPTTLAGETDDYYVFRTTSPGLSEWTAAAGVPRIELTDAEVNVTTTRVDGGVAIDVLLTNTGESDGLFVTELLINDSVVDRREVSVAPDATSLTTFVRSPDSPGEYDLRVNDRHVATVTVRAAESTATPGSSGPPVPLVPVLGAAVVLVAVVVAWLLVRRRRGTGDPDDGGASSVDGGERPADETPSNPTDDAGSDGPPERRDRDG